MITPALNQKQGKLQTSLVIKIEFLPLLNNPLALIFIYT